MARNASEFAEELIGEDREIGLLEAGGGEDVDDAFGRDGTRDDLANGMVEILLGPGIARGAFGEDGLDGLEERDVVADSERLFMGDGQRECLG